jgi:serine/threonine protein kinase
LPDEDASTNVTPPPSDGYRTPYPSRPSLKRRITRPTFMTELKQGSPVGEYEIETQIGEGAMGTVFSAIHPLIGKKVAVKVLKPELCANQASIDRFVQEAQAVNKIGHPNIVDVFSLGELEDGRAYMVMEWLRGEDLKTRLARGPMSVHDACDILDGIARALDAAHAKEIIHRDLKPDNVFLHQVEDGPLMVKLLDFGIAKLVRVTPGTEKTQTGNMLGTPRYISPEQARGIQVDHRSDIYSLGILAYEMLAGRPPFQGETAMDLVVKHLGEAPPPLSQFAKVPKSLEQCVMAMLEKDPISRPSLEEVRNILVDPSRRMTPLPTRSSMPVIPSVKPSAKWPIILGVVGAIAVAGVAWKLVSAKKAETSSASTKGEAAADETTTPGVDSEKIKNPPVAEDPEAKAEAKTDEKANEKPAEPAATRGTLEIEISGSKDSIIFVDEEERGRAASLKLELEPGPHTVVVKPPGRPSITKKVDIGAGGTSSISIVVPSAGRPTGRNTKRDTKTHTKKQSGDDELLTPKRNR